jgi:GT2 family glycosyltransferase
MNLYNPLVYIITINWNGFVHTKECLLSLQKTNYSNYKIIVIDNGSSNNEGQKLNRRFPYIQLIQNNKNKGYVVANNQGVRKALKCGADYILLLNNDTTVKSDFLTTLVDYYEKSGFRGILSPKILYYNTSKVWAMGGKLNIFTSIPRMIGQGKPSDNYNEIIQPDYAPGCAFFTKNDVLKKIGLLDERYFAYYEDTDLSFRVKRAGFNIKVIPKSIIWHKISQSTKQKSPNKLGKTQAYLYAKNGLVFGILNYHFPKNALYLASQTIIKLPLYLIFKVDSVVAAAYYIKGYINGWKFVFKIVNEKEKEL